jgi:Tol biopolymer transport system component/DNA-binding winged helix-turn-helix (wHTH) protein
MKDTRNRCYQFDDVQIDVENLRLTVNSKISTLEPKSFRLLVFLIENPGRVLPKDEIMAAVWPGAFVSDNSLARAITQVRKALADDPKTPRYIETVPTVGYRFLIDCTDKDVPGTALSINQPAFAKVAARRKRWGILAVGAVFGVVAGLAVYAFVIRGNPVGSYPLHVINISKLTSYPGDEREPAFSPDGSTIAFSWSGADGNNYDIYVVKAAGQEPLRLTTDPADDSYPAWSPDGSQIAFRRKNGSNADIVVVPTLGGPERVLHQFASIGADLEFTQHPVLCWSPDGRSIVYSGQSGAGAKYQLFRLSVETGAVQPVSVADASGAGDSSPDFSRDGKYLAFVRYLAPRTGKVMIQPLDSTELPHGNPVVVNAPGQAMRSPMWLIDGEQLLFADDSQIYQWDRKKGTVPIYSAEGTLGGLSVAPSVGSKSVQLVVAVDKWDSDIWEIPLDEKGRKATGPPQELQRSTESDAHPDYSPDGRLFTFISDRSGTPEVWVANSDGSNPRQLTHLRPRLMSYPKWSPDGTKIAFHARMPDVSEIYVVDLNQGVPRQITHENLGPGLALATWSSDGRYIYASRLVGGIATNFRMPAEGGPLQRTFEGALARESVDGKYLLYWKTNGPGIFRRSLGGDVSKNPEELLIPDFWPLAQLGGYAPVADGVYYVSGNAKGKAGPFRFFSYATRESTDVAAAFPGLGRGFAIAPDGRHLAFAGSGQIGGDLLLLNLR